MHDDQLQVTVDTVRTLIGDQFPDLAALPVARFPSEGTAHAIFRVGEDLAARFPLRPGDVDDGRQRLQAEADAARVLSRHTSVPVPAPVALGDPGYGYPLSWSIQTWVPGRTASDVDTSSSAAFAHDLAEFIRQVRAIDVDGRGFAGVGRGGDLMSHDAWVEASLRASDGIVDVTRLRAIWTRLRRLPRWEPDAMTHGDLIPGNVMVRDGRLTGVLDVGGLGPADPALDLVAAWHLLDADRRQRFRVDLACDAIAWERGKAWAFEQAVGAVWYYADTNPRMHRMGRQTLDRILADEGRHSGPW